MHTRNWMGNLSENVTNKIEKWLSDREIGLRMKLGWNGLRIMFIGKFWF
jgi:hypothetical protein